MLIFMNGAALSSSASQIPPASTGLPPDSEQIPTTRGGVRGLLGRLGAALPRDVHERVAGLRRDLRMIGAGLRGTHPPSFELRSAGLRRSVATALSPRLVRVERVIAETADAVSIELADPSGAPLPFLPGQFFTLLVEIGGETLRRAYSASSDPLAPQTVRVTSKRVAGGKVSAYLNEQVTAGMMLRVLGPSGNFTVEPSPQARRHLILFAGGSGITPMMAILRAVLATEPASRIALVFGNRGEADILFAAALRELQAAYGERLLVRHVLSEPPPGFAGTVGILDEATVTRELAALLPDGQGRPELPELPEFFVCGPEAMMAATRRALLSRGVPPARIREERFATPQLRAPDQAGMAHPQQLELRRPPSAPRSLTVRPGETLLEAGLGAGAVMPFSCAMGGCGACKVKLVAGEVAMQEPNCLSPDERAAGFVLACVSCPRSAVTIEVP